MAISIGDKVPSAKLFRLGADGGPEAIASDRLFAGRRVVVFGLPGAFTRTCSALHLPGFVQKATAIRARDVDEIICLSVNDVFVLDAWSKAQDPDGKVTMIGDGNCDLTRAMGLDADMSDKGFATRSRRYAMIVDDGRVTHLAVEEGPGLNVSAADDVLAMLG